MRLENKASRSTLKETMEQHAVPQQISSYSFKLVGDMTLKQFLEIGGGVGVGIIFYATALPALIKWPLILISVLIGGALAFVPFEERPLEQWIFAFFRSIYSPTLYYWKKDEIKPVYFAPETAASPTSPLLPKPSTGEALPGHPATFVQYIEAAKPEETSIAPVTEQITQVTETGERISFLANLEETEKAFLSTVSNLFRLIPQPPPIPKTITIPRHDEPKQEPKPVKIPPIKPQVIAKIPFKRQPISQTVINVEPTLNPKTVEVKKTLIGEKLPTVKTANFAANALPSAPTQPNTIAGQVLNTEGKIIEGAILEIKDAAGRPARAVRTNKTGHFFITIPFTNGKYEIITEKEGYIFDPVSFEAKGELIPSISIKAKAKAEIESQDLFKI
jgi:hypothetical protein